MLSPEEKTRIERRAEAEAYREALRPRRLLKVRLWALLNSAFFLWFLSAVVVTGLSSYLTARERLAKEQAAMDARIIRLQYEFGQRWKRFSYATRGRGFELSSLPAHQQELEVYLFETPAKSRVGAVFPEYAEHSLSSLMLELQILATDPSMITSLRKLRREHERLAQRFRDKITDDREKSLADGISQFQLFWRQTLSDMGYQGDAQTFDNDGNEILPPDFTLSKTAPNPALQRTPASGRR